MDTWKVNSYGYPNPFRESDSARHSWNMLRSFVDESSYAAVKQRWQNGSGRQVTPHTVESWKATFEEFGLLYVLSRTDDIVVTPGGHQLVAAAGAGDESEFCWVGLNLLLRYPLSGVSGRRSRGPAFALSDLPLYWFIFACLLDLDGLWQTELYRILCPTFTIKSARQAARTVRQLRADPSAMQHIADPVTGTEGGTYNSLNQVMVHGSLNHMLFSSHTADSPYSDSRENYWSIRHEHKELIRIALGGGGDDLPQGCANISTFVDRMPAANPPDDEQSYFEYLGARTHTLKEAAATVHSGAGSKTISLGGEVVHLLKAGKHFDRVGHLILEGSVAALCVLSAGARVICSDDLERTYKVAAKELSEGAVMVQLTPARKISNPTYVSNRFEE